MGEIRVKVRFESYDDKLAHQAGRIPETAIRTRETDAVVDTGAVMMLLPLDLVEELGLKITGRTTALLANNQTVELPCAGPVHLTLVGRDWMTDCLVGPPGCETLIGQLVMERLDLIPDPRLHTLTVRPESPLGPTLKLKGLNNAIPHGTIPSALIY